MRRVLLLASLVLLSALPSRMEAQAATGTVTLLPGDVLKVEVWREEDLSGAFIIDESGIVTLPLLGPRKVVDIPVDSLRAEIIKAFQEQLRNPAISITPLRRVYVLGQVNKPGLYQVDPTVSLAGAVAAAGGASAEGDLRNVRVVRAGEVVVDRVPAQSALAQIDIRSGDQIFVGSKGWFTRNSNFVVSVLLSITSIAISILR